jgi:hypothetical protein
MLMLTLEFSLTEKQYLDWHYYTVWQSPARANYRTRQYISGIAFYAMFGVLFFFAFYRPGIPVPAIWVGLIVMAIVVIISTFNMRSRFDTTVRSFLQQSGGDEVLSTKIFTIGEKGIHEKSATQETQYFWNAFINKAMANDCYYLYTNSMQAIIIPNRAFRSPEEKQQFDSMLLKFLPFQAEVNSFENK